LVDAAIAHDWFQRHTVEETTLLVVEQIALDQVSVGTVPQALLSTTSNQSTAKSPKTSHQADDGVQATRLTDQLLEAVFEK